jgi:hypothetical protein
LGGLATGNSYELRVTPYVYVDGNGIVAYDANKSAPVG